MLLPSGIFVDKSTPIYPGSNFTWGEATKDCTRHIQPLIVDAKLIINSDEIEAGIIRTARELDRVRKLLGGRPIWVNSWYRPSHINRAVGGSKYSRHQYGDAVDIRSNYHSPQQIYRMLRDVHSGGLGRYFGFVHIDWRPEKARWSA